MPEIDNNVRYEILGAVRVHTGACQATMTTRERTLLVALLLNANEFVDRSRLVDAIWGERPPRDARNQLQSCVSRLRKRLAAAGVPAKPIVTHPAGYEIRIPPEYVDLWQFRRRVGEARAAIEQDERSAAVASYRAALSVWRGPALAGIDSHLLRQAAASLEEERVRAAEECLDLELAQGAAGELVAELTELVAQHPYRERLHTALMEALYRDGRRADALAAYQRLRRLLVEELGTEPGPPSRELHQRILREDPPLAIPRGEPATTSLGARRCLPRSIGDFTGRDDAVSWLIEAATEPSATPVILTIDGMAGIGKTTVAVHVAHLLADRYPDAQLFVDLHGHSEHRPLEPSAALGSLLRQLGIASGRIPPELDERVALWRNELAERQALVMLDNAASTAQVTPLLPAGPGCLVLITSRRRLVGLDSARSSSLDQLTAAEAISLLAKIAGDRVHREPDAASDVVRRCGYLPLAVRLASSRLAHRTTWRVADLANRLLESRQLLAEFVAENRSVANAFALSYSNLTSDRQRLLRLLSLHPGDEIDPSAAAAIVDCRLAEAREALDDLVDQHLLVEYAPRRYRLHDLLREYASWLGSSAESEQERRCAVDRLCDFYLHTSRTNVTRLKGMSRGRTASTGAAMRPDLMATAANNIAWLEEERSNLVAAVRAAFSMGSDRYAWQLAHAAWPFLYYMGYIDDLRETHVVGLAAARRLGDDAAAATMCNYLASAYYKDGELNRSHELLSCALEIDLKHARWTDASGARVNLALVKARLGQFAEAVTLLERSIEDMQRTDDPYVMAKALQNLGLVYICLGQYSNAAKCHRRRLAISRELGDIAGLANPLGSLGTIRCRLGHYNTAMRFLTTSLGLQRRYGKREGEYFVENDLGVLFRKLNRWTDAISRHRAALAIAQDVGDRLGECAVRSDLARTLYEAGSIVAALEEYRVVLAGATKIGLKYERALALDGIAACVVSTEPEQARRHWELALVEYREMGVPEQAQVERVLATL